MYDIIAILLILTFLPMVVLFILDIVFIIKKEKKKVIILSTIIAIWISICFIEHYYINNIYNGYIAIKEDTGIDVESCSLIKKYFDENGFSRDYNTLIKLDCSDSKKYITNQMKKYEKLPIISSNLKSLFLHEPEKELLNAKNGWFYFIPELSENNYYSKYVIVVYDTNTNIFYYHTYKA